MSDGGHATRVARFRQRVLPFAPTQPAATARFAENAGSIPHGAPAMSIRMLALACLAGASLAAAAPPKSTPKQDPVDAAQTAESLDVDAMARAKDVSGTTPAAEDAPPSQDAAAAAQASEPAPAESVTTQAAPAEAAPTEAAPPDAAPSEAPPPLAPAPEADAPVPVEAQAPVVETAAPAESAPADATPKSLEAPPDVAPDAQKVSIAAGCVSRATSVLDDAEKADYGNATRDFNPTLRSQMPAAKFKQQWESLSQFGKLVARGQSHLGTGEGYTVVMIPLIFEKTNLVAQFACGSDGRIAGFHVNQAPKPKL
jgi:uncharacterized protein DUF3887